MSLRSSNQDAAVRLLASLDHKLKKAKKGWEECMPAHSSHGMETLFTPAEIEATDTAYADFMRLLRLSWDYCSQCFEYGAVKVLFPSLNKDAKLNQASTNRFKTLFRRQDSFGGLPPAFLYCLCRGTYNQGKELKLAPIVDLLNQETTFINGDTLPSKAYVLALSSIYAQINDIEREAGRSRTDKKRMCEYNDGVTADMPSDSEDGYDEQNTTGKLEPSFQFFDELDANEENTSVIPASNTAKLCSEKQASSEKILELMENSGFKKEDIAFAKVILVYTLSGKKIPWDRIAGFLPQKWRLAGRKKTCDYWRKTLCPKIQNLID
ncbi:MAG: hypothetical protein A2X49_01510 [Lentisphaerae bacterium GWF2_52_8]|nr:MAG: hypothetical protein A2X49_01510 [Lentisphaerae bacterium GWF2_52_8]